MDSPRYTCVCGSFAPLVLLTTLGAFWFACAPAAAQLSVSAPSRDQVRRMQDWYVRHIPLRFRARTPLLIRELDDTQMTAYLKGGDYDTDGSAAGPVSHTGEDAGDIDGIFESDPDRIALRLSPESGADLFTFAHEYGHFVWFHLLSRADRKRYEAVYKRQLAGHHLVTRYAATDVEEGFAEAFSFYVSEPPFLAWRDAQSFLFLKQCTGQARS